VSAGDTVYLVCATSHYLSDKLRYSRYHYH
jgi:hypothetical protein